MTFANTFLNTAEAHPNQLALTAEGHSLSYAELRDAAIRIARHIGALPGQPNPLCAVLGAETSTVYTAILGVLMAGAGYVPLNPSFPAARTLHMMETSGVASVVADRNGQAKVGEILELAVKPYTILLPDALPAEIDELQRKWPAHRIIGNESPLGLAPFVAPKPDDQALAYVMFTSGSTGQPKGVAITHANLRRFVAAMNELYDFRPGDRFSCMFDITFDASVLDIFVCWSAAGELCVVPKAARVAPAHFIRTQELTVWFSVPSTATLMYQIKALKDGAFPTLRYSFFCGEPLPAAVAQQWQKAAVNSVVDNLYGPTEATVACMKYHWRSEVSPQFCENGIVPIGRAFPGVEVVAIDDELQQVAKGETGELCIRGPQTALGYWKNEALTGDRFVALPWAKDREENRWYRTGDLVRQNDQDDFIFVGRVDNQVKILGYRVELGEIEARLLKHGKTAFAVAIPIRAKEGSAVGVVACLVDSDSSEEDVISGCREDLPEYMVPKRVFYFDSMPLSVNGKVDRRRLAEWVEEKGLEREA